MGDGELVNEPTESRTERLPCKAFRKCGCTTARLGPFRFLLKVLQLGLTFTAIVLQALLEYCTQCWGLIFFEFVCGFTFHLGSLILAIYSTSLYERVQKDKLNKFDFWFVALVAILFPVASFALFETYDRKSDKTATVLVGFFAGIAFAGDSVTMCCEAFLSARETQEEDANGPPTPEDDEPLDDQLLDDQPV